MPEFQLLRCEVALGGDTGNTVVRHRGSPILFPELILLQNIHGEDAVTDVAVIGTTMMSNDEARLRLDTIYGPEAVTLAFPGARPRIPAMDPSIPICDRPVYQARPTLPDNPDPVIRPLTALEPMANQRTVAAPPLPRETAPTPEEIAAHAQDDEPVDEDLGFDAPTGPRIEDQTATRVSFRGGQAHQAARTPDHLPDVAGPGQRGTRSGRAALIPRGDRA